MKNTVQNDVINIFKDNKKFKSTKLNAFDYLLNIRNSLIKKFNLTNFYFFNKQNSSKIDKNQESEIILSEILVDNNSFYIITDSILITVYLNQKQIYKFNFSKYEKVKNFINIISNKIPHDSTLILDGFESDIKEFENDDIIDILDDNNNVYFKSSNQIEENIQNEEEKNNENILIQSKEKIIINYGKNTKIEKLDISMNLKDCRKLFKKKNIINFYFIY